MTTPAIILGLLIAPVLLAAILNRLARRTVASLNLFGCVGTVRCFLALRGGGFTSLAL